MESKVDVKEPKTIGKMLFSFFEFARRFSVHTSLVFAFSGVFGAAVYFKVQQVSYTTQIDDLKTKVNNLKEQYDLQIQTLNSS